MQSLHCVLKIKKSVLILMDLTNANVIQDIKNGMTHREALMVNNAMILMNALHPPQYLVLLNHIGQIVIV